MEGKGADPSGKAAASAAHFELDADSDDIRCTVAVAAKLGRSAVALDLDSVMSRKLSTIQAAKLPGKAILWLMTFLGIRERRLVVLRGAWVM